MENGLQEGRDSDLGVARELQGEEGGAVRTVTLMPKVGSLYFGRWIYSGQSGPSMAPAWG